jgi:Lipopolysaccharide-assembly
MRRLLRIGAVAAGLTLVGCGYRVGSTGEDVPPEARTISIELFRNHTREAGLEVRLRSALEEEFRRRGTLRVVTNESSDLELRGDIRRLQSRPVGSSGIDEVIQYEAVITVDIRMIERATGRVIAFAKGLQESQDFGAVSGVVITSSPRFQRGTINARDLANLDNVQIGPARRRDAVKDLLGEIAHTVYRYTMEGF